MVMYLSGKFYSKKITIWEYLKMLKLPVTFVLLALKGSNFLTCQSMAYT